MFLAAGCDQIPENPEVGVQRDGDSIVVLYEFCGSDPLDEVAVFDTTDDEDGVLIFTALRDDIDQTAGSSQTSAAIPVPGAAEARSLAVDLTSEVSFRVFFETNDVPQDGSVLIPEPDGGSGVVSRTDFSERCDRPESD